MRQYVNSESEKINIREVGRQYKTRTHNITLLDRTRRKPFKVRIRIPYKVVRNNPPVWINDESIKNNTPLKKKKKKRYISSDK